MNCQKNPFLVCVVICKIQSQPGRNILGFCEYSLGLCKVTDVGSRKWQANNAFNCDKLKLEMRTVHTFTFLKCISSYVSAYSYKRPEVAILSHTFQSMHMILLSSDKHKVQMSMLIFTF